MKKKILNIFIRDTIIACSWGIKDVRDIPNGIEFTVNGFKLKGKVRLLFNIKKELIDVYFLDRSNNVIDKKFNVKIEDIIEIIDNRVEKSENYYQKVFENNTLGRNKV